MMQCCAEEAVTPEVRREPVSRMRLRRLTLYAGIFLVALASVAWQVSTKPSFGFGRYWESVAVARSLAGGQGFANPFGALETGPTAHLAPVFPGFLAALIGVFGDNGHFALVAIAACMLAHAIYCVLFIPLSSLLFHDRRPGIIAGVFCALVPTIQFLPQWEAIYAAVAGQLFCIAAARSFRFGWGWIAGAVCGLMLLLNPALVFIALAWLAWLRPDRRRLAAFALTAALACSPWMLRNYGKFGSVFFIRDNLGLELYTSNSDCSHALELENRTSGCHARTHPNANREEAATVLRMGEVEYNRSRMSAAFAWMRSHPGSFLQLSLARVREFWFPTPAEVPVLEYSRWLITALSIAGLGVLIAQRDRAAIFLCGAMALYPAVYYFVQASTRYRTPALWISVLPAAYAIDRVLRALRSPAVSAQAAEAEPVL